MSYTIWHEFDHDANGSIDIEEFFHTLADLDAPDKNLTLIMAESKQAELDTYTTKLENIRKLNMKKFKSRKGRSFMVGITTVIVIAALALRRIVPIGLTLITPECPGRLQSRL